MPEGESEVMCPASPAGGLPQPLPVRDLNLLSEAIRDWKYSCGAHKPRSQGQRGMRAGAPLINIQTN